VNDNEKDRLGPAELKQQYGAKLIASYECFNESIGEGIRAKDMKYRA